MLDFSRYMKYDGSGIKIVVLDTGACQEDKDIEKGIGILISEDGSILKTKNIEDDIGHGTAVISILQRYVPQASIIPIKIIYNGIMAHEEVLIEALEYIEKILNVI